MTSQCSAGTICFGNYPDSHAIKQIVGGEEAQAFTNRDFVLRPIMFVQFAPFTDKVLS
jgi:hypothetical protein